jgi:N,N'-diacetyllegionaminate synthase
MTKFNKPFIIGETAFHHQGEKDFLIKLVDEAAALKLDAIKFHLLFDLPDYMVKDHQALDTLAKLCIPEKEWGSVYQHATKAGLKIVFLCNDVKSLAWVTTLKDEHIVGIELHATGINDIFLLAEAVKFNGSVFLGTGGSTLDEISFAVTYLKDRGKNDIVLMHGFQNYPTNYSDVILSKMQILQNLFGLPLGYADHTDPADVNNEMISCLGVAMGFNIIEKHFTTMPGVKRIDSQSAISIDQMKRVQQLAQIIWQTRGINPLGMSVGELKYGDTGPMKKAIVARRAIAKGETVTEKDLAYRRTNGSSYVKQNTIHLFVGQKALTDIAEDEIIDFTKVEFGFKLGDFTQFANK